MWCPKCGCLEDSNGELHVPDDNGICLSCHDKLKEQNKRRTVNKGEAEE